MGMYTHFRGWIEIDDINFSKEEFEDIQNRIKDLSPRATCCLSCITFNIGFNWCPYIFVGGEIKNYDNDWDIVLNALMKELNVSDYNIERRYEEEESWRKWETSASYSQTKEKQDV